MDGILWCCHPQILSIILDNNLTRKFYKFVCEKLTDGENQEGCCHSTQSKCWVHALKVKNVVLDDLCTGVELNVPFCRYALMEALLVPEARVRFFLMW